MKLARADALKMRDMRDLAETAHSLALTERERAVTSPYDFNLTSDLGRVPLQLGGWTGVDVPQTNLEVAILLEPEQYVYRLYTHPDGHSLWLSLIGSRKSKSFHSPQICYDTDGWQTTAGSEPVQLADGQVYALRLLAATGLIEQRPRRGAVVARPEPARLAEMFQAMAELEATCATLCAPSGSAGSRAPCGFPPSDPEISPSPRTMTQKPTARGRRGS